MGYLLCALKSIVAVILLESVETIFGDNLSDS